MSNTDVNNKYKVKPVKKRHLGSVTGKELFPIRRDGAKEILWLDGLLTICLLEATEDLLTYLISKLALGPLLLLKV